MHVGQCAINNNNWNKLNIWSQGYTLLVSTTTQCSSEKNNEFYLVHNLNIGIDKKIQLRFKC